MSTIKETTLHPDNDPNVNLYPRTLATLVEGLDVAITTKAPRPVACKIILPKGATNGTLTEEQLTILSASPSNYIEMVNDKELYYLNDPGHESGFYTYSHVGIENSKATIKTLTITVSAKSFVIITTVIPVDDDSKYFNKREILLAPKTGDTISEEQLMNLDTGFYFIDSCKIFNLNIIGWYNLEVFHSSGHRTLLLESSTNDIYVAQILNDPHKTFVGWAKITTTNVTDTITSNVAQANAKPISIATTNDTDTVTSNVAQANAKPISITTTNIEQKNINSPKEYLFTPEQERIQEKAKKIAEYKSYLLKTDYVVIKISEAMAEGNETLKQELMLQYAGVLAIRKAYRQELNK